MEDNRKFATFFADAPKGKKIGAVLSWIATVILLVALFVPGYQLRYQMKTEKGTFKDMHGMEHYVIIMICILLSWIRIYYHGSTMKMCRKL